MIHDIPTCKDLVERIEREAGETLSKASSLWVSADQVPDESPNVKQGLKTEGVPPEQQGKAGKQTPGAEIWGIGKQSKL